jgi:hypothetical protein
MYYSYVEFEYVATSFSPARTDLAVKLFEPQECECTKLREPPPVPYMPTKDEVQKKVAKLRNLKIKTTIKKDTTLNFLVWHKKGT